jgi:uncharacterized protein (TIGR03435 family)
MRLELGIRVRAGGKGSETTRRGKHLCMLTAALSVAVLLVPKCLAQSANQPPESARFDAVTVKPVDPDSLDVQRGFRMAGAHEWVAKNVTLRDLIALAYDVSPKAIFGIPFLLDTERFSIDARTPGQRVPTEAEQMQMVRALLTEQFALGFHWQEKELPIYELTIAKAGPKLRQAASPEERPQLMAVAMWDKTEIPAKNVTMDEFVALLQRSALDRPALNATRLTGSYDFTLIWAPIASRYTDERPRSDEPPTPPLFLAIQDQMGLKLTPGRGTVKTMVVDGVRSPRAK